MDDDNELAGLYVKGEEHWITYFWRLLILILLALAVAQLYQIDENTRHSAPPRTEVFVHCDGTNCTFSESLEDLSGG